MKKEQRHMTLEIQVLACDGHKDVARFNRLMEPQPSLLDNRISNGNGNDKKPEQIRFHSKGQHTITKMNDNINMGSTITGSRFDYESSVSDPF
jgi:hypothetical protein